MWKLYGLKTVRQLKKIKFGLLKNGQKKKAQEQIRFDQRDHKATRSTVTGGKNSFPIPPCARDSLTFLYFLREQLAAGRIPPPDDVYFGAQYQVVLTYLETRNIEVANTLHLTDRILIDIQGPKSELNFEIFFSKDEARIPMLILLSQSYFYMNVVMHQYLTLQLLYVITIIKVPEID